MAELEYLRSALAGDPSLCDRVLAAAEQSRDTLQLFVDVARFLTRPQPIPNGDSSSKKRKLDSDDLPIKSEGISSSFDPSSTSLLLDLPDISFTIPVRKKLSVRLLTSPSGGADAGGIQITGKDVGYNIPWSSVGQVLCLPVPEKTARQQTFVVVLDVAEQGETQFAFTLPETPYVGDCGEKVEGDTWVTLTGRMVNTVLMGRGKGVTLPDEGEFKSAVGQSHRKGEVGYHVKAHLGSKDGYLFFLSTGIVFGFRKPIMLFPFHEIESISYTSVLQRTFNLVIATQGDGDEAKEVEFSMLDQVDFASIDEYIKRHELNDASMAKERMAKRIGVNDPKRRKGEDAPEQDGEHVNGQEEESELQKAERELQDEEDEEEEDYDPGSEGESEGEGSDSEEEYDGNDQGQDLGEDLGDGAEDEEAADDDMAGDELE